MMVMMRMTKVLVGVGERATQEYIRSTVLLPSKDCLDGWWIFVEHGGQQTKQS